MDARDTFTLIDVREAYEYEEFNIGGRHIPLDTLAEHVEMIRSEAARPIYIHCKSGMRSAVAQEFLESAGIADVFNVDGGVTAWQAAGYDAAR